jgi:glycosyltransferase involved in cell wall biosynthesis
MTVLRVALVSEHASPLATLGGVDAGGQNVHVAALARELTRRGCQVIVHTRRDAADLPVTVRTPDGYLVDHVDAGPPAPIPKDAIFDHLDELTEGLRSRWRTEPPDVVHAHFWMSGVASVAARPLSHPPVVQTFHALGVVKRRHQGDADTSPPARLELERQLARQVDLVVATCRDEAMELDALGAPAARVRIVPCGVDRGVFTPSGPTALRRPGRLRLVTVGRLVPRKGVADVIAALALIPDAELVVVGGPPAADLDGDPEVGRLHNEAARHDVSSRVTFTGSLPRHAVASLLRSADVVVCAPWYEPFGIVPVEAMACGVPVVGTAVGGLLDTVVPGVTGLLVPPRDPDALARAVRTLAREPALREAMGRLATARAAGYQWSRVGRATLEAYRSVARRGAMAMTEATA